MRKTVLFLIPHLGGGGAERVTAHLAAGLPEKKYSVHLAMVAQGTFHREELPERVTVHDLRAPRIRQAALPLLRLVWELKPDLIFSCMYHLNFLVLSLRPLLPRRTRCIVRQNGMVGPVREKARLTRALYRALYPQAERIVCQTHEMASEIGRLAGKRAKLRVLPNPVAIGRPADNSTDLWTGSGPRLLAIGRLAPQKGFDLLLPAFAEVCRQWPGAQLAILGQGPDEKSLMELAQKLGVGMHVTFAGYVQQPQEWFRGASAFVLSSRYEGLSNAMLEAAAEGLPIVATPGLGGVRELLDGHAGCWVAGEVTAEALGRTLVEALGALQPGERVAHAWLEEFRMENSLRRYEALFDEVLEGERA